MAALPRTQELRLRRSSVHRHHDVKRLDDGEDLNDALLDFFVKLGQAVIPCGGLEGGFRGFPSVAYLGSLFHDILRKGGVTEGRTGHANVANWARRRLGEGGLFFDGIGALAVPVNETLRDSAGRSAPKEKHWWLAVVLNPRGGVRPEGEEETCVLCLDSVVRAEVRYDPPLRVQRRGSQAYPLEVHGLYRQGFGAYVRFRAIGDGSLGAVPDPKRARLVAAGKEWGRPQANLSRDNLGGHGVPARAEGILEFALESDSPICGEYTLEFDEAGNYSPAPRLDLKREPSDFQKGVGSYLGGYIAKEWESANKGETLNGAVGNFGAERLEKALRLPDVPQQETANDCGFFILAQILLILQLTPEGLRTLAGASTDMLSSLPWPTQKEVTRRKARLRQAVLSLFAAAEEMLTDDVDELLRKNQELRRKVQALIWDGPTFAEAVRRLAAASAPRRDYTMEELAIMTTKALRTLCNQRGCLPAGLVERADLLRALAPSVMRSQQGLQASPTSPPVGAGPAVPTGPPVPTLAELLAVKKAPEPEAKRQRTGPPDPADSHLGNMRFSLAELQKMPLKTLRGLCMQHKVLPANALERGDFVRPLERLATDAPTAAQPTAATAGVNGAALNGRAAPSTTGATVAPAMTAEERKAKWANSANMHLAGMIVEREDLDVMPLKILRALCIQHQVLPSCAVERGDFVHALAPKVGMAAPGGQAPPDAAARSAAAPGRAPGRPEEPKKDFSRFLGQSKPNFKAADLEPMPETTLRTLCIQHGVLPHNGAGAAADRAALLGALARITVDAPVEVDL